MTDFINDIENYNHKNGDEKEFNAVLSYWVNIKTRYKKYPFSYQAS